MEDDSDIPGVEEQAEDFLFDDDLDEETRQAIAEGEADIAAGRVIPHEEVMRWVETWGTPDYKPMPKAWLK